jgi:hypothetical protein
VALCTLNEYSASAAVAFIAGNSPHEQRCRDYQCAGKIMKLHALSLWLGRNGMLRMQDSITCKKAVSTRNSRQTMGISNTFGLTRQTNEQITFKISRFVLNNSKQLEYCRYLLLKT